ncbi:hypothetical protein GCM10011608_54590 [Micromonospora sonchi]|uniref:Uncharacterized protein n=1 Tax=Micromonospora sonchi TaxID=1763543 RepID=A0A917U6V1_9ACTN|nr:hypothetical protein GCM10011608_54590 [Micromonospora sonchi]
MPRCAGCRPARPWFATPPGPLLALALLDAIVAAVGPASWAAYATLTAAALTIIAVLTTNTTDTAVTLLAGAALIGLGVALIGLGIAILVKETRLTRQLREWVAALTRDPTGDESAGKDPGRVGESPAPSPIWCCRTGRCRPQAAREPDTATPTGPSGDVSGRANMRTATNRDSRWLFPGRRAFPKRTALAHLVLPGSTPARSERSPTARSG